MCNVHVHVHVHVHVQIPPPTPTLHVCALDSSLYMVLFASST